MLEGTFNDTRDLCFINGVVFIAEHASSLIHFIDLEDKVTVKPRSLKYRADLLSQLARFGTGARYARVKTYVFPSRLFFNEFSIFYVHKLSLWRNATNVKRD